MYAPFSGIATFGLSEVVGATPDYSYVNHLRGEKQCNEADYNRASSELQAKQESLRQVSERQHQANCDRDNAKRKLEESQDVLNRSQRDLEQLEASLTHLKAETIVNVNQLVLASKVGYIMTYNL